MVEHRSEATPPQHVKERLQSFTVEKVLCSQLLCICESGTPIYKNDYAFVKVGSRVEIMRIADSADLVPFINQRSGRPDILPLNKHNFGEIANHMTYLDRIDFAREGQEFQVNGLHGEPLEHPFKISVEGQTDDEIRIVIKLASTSASDLQIFQYITPGEPDMLSDYFSQAPCILFLKRTKDGKNTLFMYAYTPDLPSEERSRDHENQVKFLLEELELQREFGDHARYEVPTEGQVRTLTEEDKDVFFADEELTTSMPDSGIESRVINAAEFGMQESFQNDFYIWKEVREHLKTSDVFIFQAGGGLGDKIRQILFVQAIARALPNKDIYLDCPGIPAGMIDPLQLKEKNLHISQLERPEQLLVVERRAIRKKSVTVINIDANGQGKHKTRYDASTRKLFLTRSHVKSIRYFNDGRVDKGKYSWNKTGLLFNWKKVFERSEGLHSDHSYSQEALSNSFLSRMLHLDTKVDAAKNIVTKPEITIGTPQYDIVIVYDALSNGRAKLLTPTQLVEITRHFTSLGYSVALVKGRTNPADTEYVQAANADLHVIEGSLETVTASLMNARAVLTTDTAIAHILDLIIQSERALPDEQKKYSRLPQTMSVMGSKAGFSVPYFMPRTGTTLVAESIVGTIRSSEIVSQLEKMLGEGASLEVLKN